MMSADSEADKVCANCGKAAVDNIKLKICTACKLVKYCSVECQKNHRPQHKKACKKRAAELRDDKLFTQNEISHLGECPICCLPLPLDSNKSMIYSCCCQRICNGCVIANQKRELEQGLEMRCSFCREPVPKTEEVEEEEEKNVMKRVKANDPAALRLKGVKCYNKGDYEGAFEYYTKAAELGDMDAHYKLSGLYRHGEGVEKDEKKKKHHLEEAAIGGHHDARHNLGADEWNAGKVDKAMRHYTIAAKLGDDGALENVKNGFSLGVVSKDDYEAALRGHQAAVDAMKSEQRDAAEEFFRRRNQI
jgi:tetratricopeptide (TPR) repeat protein